LVQGGLIGLFVKYLGEKRMLLVGSLLMSVGLFTMPIVSAELFIPIELLAITTIALSNGLIMPAANAIVSKQAPANQQGTVLGAMQSLGSLARTIGPLFSGILYMIWYSMPYFTGTLLMLISFGISAVLLKKK
jgi:MFS family permease